MKVTITVVTTSLFGKPKQKEVVINLESNGVSLADALKEAGVAINGMQVSIDGTPVSDQNLHVKDGARIQLAKGARVKEERPKVQLTERASGS